MRAWKKKKGTSPQLQTTNVKKSKGKKKVVAENDEAAKAARKGKNKRPVEEEDVASSDSEDDSSMSSVSSSSSSASSSDSSSSSDDSSSSSSSDSSTSDSGDSSSSSDSDDSSSDDSSVESIESPVMKSKKLKKKKRVPSVLQIVSKKSSKKIPRSRPPARSRSLSRTRSRSIGRPVDSREEEHTVTKSRSRSNGRPPLGITRSFGNIRKVASRLGRVGQRHSRRENGDNLSQFSEDNESKVAADAFGRDMKKLGYNLSYDSFVSKGSSATEEEERDERYAPMNTEEKTREESHERYMQKDTINGHPSSTRNDHRAHYEPKNIRSNETDSEVGALTGTSLDSRLSSLQITASTGDFSQEGELEICMSDVTNTSEKLRAESVRPTSSASRRLIRPPSPEDGSQLVVTASGIQEFTRNAASRRIPETSGKGKGVIRAPVSTKHGKSQEVYIEQPSWAKMLNMETFTPKSQNTVAAMSTREGEPENSSGAASSPCSLSRNSRPSSVPPRRKLSHEPSRRNTDKRGPVQTVSKGDGRVSSLTNESNLDQESFSLPPKRNMAPSPPVVIQGIHEIVRNDSHDPKLTSPIFIEGMSFMEHGGNEPQLAQGEFQDDLNENAPASSVPKRSRNRRRRSWFPSRIRTSKGKKSANTVDPILDDRPSKASQLEIVRHETDLDAKEQFDNEFDRVVQKIPGAKSPKRGSKSPLRKVANLLTPGSAKRDSKPMDTTPDTLHKESTAVTTGPFATPATEAPAPDENGEVLGEKHFFGPNFESKEVETKTVASGRQSCSTAGKTMLTQHERIEVEIDEDARKQAKKRGPRPLFSFLRKKQTDEADQVKVSVEEAPPKKKGKKSSESRKQEVSENGEDPLHEEKRVPADTANVLGPSTRHGPNATKPSPTSARGDKNPAHVKLSAKDQEALTDGIPPPLPMITIDEDENAATGARREKRTVTEGLTSAQATGRSRRGIPQSPRAHNAPDTALAKTFGDFINVLFDKNQKAENSSTTTTSAFGFGIGACGVPMCANDSTAIEVVKHEGVGSRPVLGSQEACANRSRRVLGVTDYGIDDIDEKSHTSSSVKVTLAKPLPPPPQRRGNEVEKPTTESQEAEGKLLPFFNKRQNKGGSRASSKEPLETASKKQSSKASKSSSKMSKASSKKSKKSAKKAANSDYSWRSNHKKSQKATPSNPPAMEIQTGGTYDGSTLTSLPDGAYQHRAKGAIKGVRSPIFSLESEDDSMGHTWAEIADASLVVERAINKIETMQSDDTDTSRKIKSLLSNDTDTDGAATADVEQALQVLRKHADRLGVRESDLLLAVKSEDIESVEEVSVRSLTFTEEVMEAFNMYLKTPR